MNISRLLNLMNQDKLFLSYCDPVAQVVEQRPFKADVEGSSPSWVTFFFHPKINFTTCYNGFSKKPLIFILGIKILLKEKTFLFLRKYWVAFTSSKQKIILEIRRRYVYL